jgi:hypothetical protein
MKTKAWGWLTAAVLAAALNSSYHNGGLQWAHEIAERVEHNTGAVLALATGRADQFLAEARMLNADRTIASAMKTEASRCPFARTTSDLQNSFDRSQDQFQFKLDRFQALSDREQARLERLAAKRERIENQVRAKLAQVRIPEVNFTPVVVRVPEVHVPEIDCPRVRVNVERMPRIKVPAAEVHVGYSGPGPV